MSHTQKNTTPLPHSYFGGKSSQAPMIWERLGDTMNYSEPFFGGGSVAFLRPPKSDHTAPRHELVNDKNIFITNFWRSVKNDPTAVSKYADERIDEADLAARHKWLVGNQEFKECMFTDPLYYDPMVAGWWVWGMSIWLGSGWCDLSKAKPAQSRPNLRPCQGIYKSAIQHMGLPAYMEALQERVKNMRVLSGDWKRCVTPSVTHKIGQTAVFLDPPYALNTERMHQWVRALRGDDAEPAPAASTNRVKGLYANEENQDIDKLVAEVNIYCQDNGDNPKLRIAVCGLAGEHDNLEGMGWTAVSWKTNGGMDGQRKSGENDNRNAEVIWFSPHCLIPVDVRQLGLF